MTAQEKKDEAIRFFWVVVGTFLDAFFMNVITIPVGIYAGGIMGFAQIIRTIINNAFNIPMEGFDMAGIIYFFINIPLFIIAKQKLGRMYLFRTVSCVLVSTFWYSVIPIPATPIIDDVLSCVLIGGICAGLGGGLILRSGSANGGSDIIATLLVHKYQNLKVSVVTNGISGVAYVIMAFMFNLPTAMYSGIRSVMYSISVDKIYSQNIIVEAHIITDTKFVKPLQEAIIKRLNRGVTKWDAIGAYTENDKEVLYVILNKYEISSLIEIVRKIDPSAMIIENDGVRIDGNFLKKIT